MLKILKRKPESVEDLKAAINKIEVEIEVIKDRLAAHKREMGAAALGGKSLEVLNAEKREMEDAISSLEEMRAAAGRNLRERRKLENEQTFDRLARKQVENYLRLDSLLRQVADLLTEMSRDDREMAGVSLEPPRSRPFSEARRIWTLHGEPQRPEDPSPVATREEQRAFRKAGEKWGEEHKKWEECRRERLIRDQAREKDFSMYTHDHKLVVDQNYSKSVLAEVIELMRAQTQTTKG